MDNTGVIIQARRSSTRLKDKIIMNIPALSNNTMLCHVITRAKKACGNVIVATSQENDDDITEIEAKKYGAKVFRGSLDDVLLRYIKAAEKYNINRIVRITADCPCIDYNIITNCIKKHINTNADYVSNVEKRTFPHGLDVEVVSLDALYKTNEEEKDIKIREHVTWYIRQNSHFKKEDYIEENGFNYSDIRVTVDTNEDYALMNLIFYMLGNDFGYKEMVNLFQTQPWLKLLNNNIYQKYVCKTNEDEIKEAIKLLELNGMIYTKNLLEQK